MCRRMLCRVVVDRLLDGNWQPHVEIDVGGGGGGEQAGDGGGEEALEEPGYSTCNMSMLKLVKKGSIDACHLKQPLGPGKSQLVLTNLHDGLAIGSLWDAPKMSPPPHPRCAPPIYFVWFGLVWFGLVWFGLV